MPNFKRARHRKKIMDAVIMNWTSFTLNGNMKKINGAYNTIYFTEKTPSHTLRN